MRVLHVNESDIAGGAARAAFRILQAQRGAGLDARMAVNRAHSGDWTVTAPDTLRERISITVRRSMVQRATDRLSQPCSGMASMALLRTRWPERFAALSAEVVNLHWINNEMLSVRDIARVHVPVVWTLHDMWAFCGAEHYTQSERWRVGYTPQSRPVDARGPDFDRWVWRRKQRAWRRPIQIVTPSRWLADCVRESALMRGWPVRAIPNPIDTSVWQPVDQRLARRLLGLPETAPLLLFGAMGGTRDPRKGYDLLVGALAQMQGRIEGLRLVVFGERQPREAPDLGFPVHYMGRLADDPTLRLLYSAADVMVIPSRMDNLPNTGVEAQVCGTPVAAFDVGGLPDIVEPGRSGYLARPFESGDLAEGILWLLADPERRARMRVETAERAARIHDPSRVAGAYAALYEELLDVHHSGLAETSGHGRVHSPPARVTR